MFNILKIPVRLLRRKQHLQRFRKEYGTFYGVFDTLEEAQGFGARAADADYDNADVPLSYKEKLDRGVPPNTSDYPILYWLEKICGESECGHVFDFGGSVGVHYNMIAPRIGSTLRWTVCELPRTVEIGEKIASERAWKNVRFTSDFSLAQHSTVLLASGSLQYVQEGFLNKLRSLEMLPRYLLLGKVPLYAGRPFFTIQNAGVCLCPTLIYNKAAFLEELGDLGYVVRDLWEDPSRSCIIPYAPENSFTFFYGLFMERPASRSARSRPLAVSA